MPYDSSLDAFAAAIVDPDRPVPAGLIGPDGAMSERRFAVYRNNVVAGLCDALSAAYPVTRRIVGEEFFAGMARIYVALTLPQTPVMLDYGAAFADFIGTFEPAMSLPYLRDVARLERAWVEAYHASDATPLEADAFRGIDAAQLPSMRLALHPSVRVVRSAFPLVAIWQTNIDEGAPGFIDIHARSEDAYVARPLAHVEVRVLPRGAAAFIEALAAGNTLADAFESARSTDARFDLSQTLSMLMNGGAIIGWVKQ
ncbi:DNA-binding domain-containing protein [Caballeronia sp. INDeC2]|uniref:HvfC/BufC N-terminal domain-containing protein n=1 Tax=Caballeronia sp. INDeC2 TaxID=2921747 RepID=UPI00202773EF|nr:DNA-binding domain-containing protein [Caballeronia sp. INDeC2]